ncbi:hypothetical protein M407DRAFT_28331 [Tulasnella calospora MUT 4182]|uniref:Uncharacterized protein n=1 Tax=Tulasnella calospora MUT 4182 TaxID=1051891 RepID=A0A0C3KL13_9AGAM|nr:hypothetical protein M407DRAFT_28331 [Tulasnella calospora MUT 4182]
MPPFAKSSKAHVPKSTEHLVSAMSAVLGVDHSILPRCVPSPAIPHPQSPSPELLENLCDLERWNGSYEESAACMKKALAICKERGDSKGIASALRKQAVAFYQFDDYVKAMELASDAL